MKIYSAFQLQPLRALSPYVDSTSVNFNERLRKLLLEKKKAFGIFSECLNPQFANLELFLLPLGAELQSRLSILLQKFANVDRQPLQFLVECLP